MSKNWKQTQAVDYAIQQEGFVSTVNRVYNKTAGTEPLFPDQRKCNEAEVPLYTLGSQKRISWDSRAAMDMMYWQYRLAISNHSTTGRKH